MHAFRRSRSLLCLTLAALAAACSSAPTEVAVAERVHPATSLSAIGSIERVLALKETAALNLGSISRVRIDERSGDLLALDGDLTRTLYRFSRAGELKAQYVVEDAPGGRPEPIPDFAVLPDSSVVVSVGRRFERFDAGGRRTARVSLDAAPIYLTTVRDSVCAVMITTDPADDLVRCYDRDLESAASYHPYDERLRRYWYGPTAPLASAGDVLFVSGMYSREVTAYDVRTAQAVAYDDGKSVVRTDLDGLWEQDRLTDTARAEIRKRVRRYRMIHAVPGGLFLYDTQTTPQVRIPGLFDTERRVVHRFPHIDAPIVLGNGRKASVFDFVVGAYSGGVIIGVPRDLVSAFAIHHPHLADIAGPAKFGAPLLVFFRTRALPLVAGDR